MSNFSTGKRSNQDSDKAVLSVFVADALKVLPQRGFQPEDTFPAEIEDLNVLDAWYSTYSPSAAPPRGSKIRGTVIDERRDCFWVSYGGKSEALALKSQFGNDKLKLGETALFLVIRSEEDPFTSCTLLSRDGAIEWEKLEELKKEGGSIVVDVVGITRNDRKVTAVKVRYKNIFGFIPFSLMGMPASSAEALRNQSLEVKVHKVIPEANQFVLDRKSVRDDIFQKREEWVDSLKPGQIFHQVPVIRVVTSADNKEVGVLVQIGDSRGLVHRSELSRAQLKNSIKESFKPGDLVDVMLLPCRKSANGRSEISLSIRALQALKKKEFFQTLEVGQIVVATPQRKTNYGIFASIDLDADLDGLLHYSQCGSNGEPELGRPVEMKIIALDSAACTVALSMQDLG